MSPNTAEPSFHLENPISVKYLKEHLNPETPRLILTKSIQKNLIHQTLSSKNENPVLINLKNAITKNVKKIMPLPVVERKLDGKRLLAVSREFLYRMNVLCMHHTLHPNCSMRAVKRINEEIMAVSQFEDWNPKHFLDVGEMCMAMSLAIDWVGHDLPESTLLMAKQALIDKGIQPSWAAKGCWWKEAHNNWNQVCHGGLIAASITVAELDMDLAAKTLKRALDCLPCALGQYAPDGIYPEGSTYWEYGTSYTALTSSLLQTSLGTDFGISKYQPLMKSALFRAMSKAPSGMFYNFSDCGDHCGKDGDYVLAWFATQTHERLFFEEEKFLRPYNQMSKLSGICGAGIIWVSQFQECQSCKLPTSYHGGGCNPIAIFEHADNDYYLGTKGGMASNSHGNMDAGSFVFELDGVRWVLDPGNQRYSTLEKTGFDLWNQAQDSERWTLLTKNNFGHSTLTVNGEYHRVDGMSTIPYFHDEGDTPTVQVDMTAAFGGLLNKALRTFTKDTPDSLVIEDELMLTDAAKEIRWQMVTTANVVVEPFGATLTQGDEKSLRLELLSDAKVEATVFSLDPPPLKLDRHINGLKRIDLVFHASAFQKKKGKASIRVRLSKE